MSINLDLDQNLLAEAIKLGHLSNAQEVIDLALREFVQRRQAQEVIELFNTIDIDEDYDYKMMRQRPHDFS
ncbi:MULTISPECIES: type II toxin-antitoxin system VapB family antitoxin [Acinetobacter]|jgi:predicted kinase|uniref:DUF2191 domain-containing protein n=2 Tax=Acinetobacter TaxID=469 RepID=A0A1Z9YUR9_9GAMM|nr:MULTISPECIES: type II toxin-antitoxin system VapB family antitoxin [Acinetobacter]MCH4248336.1 type II toxin-antitoxin system VapB family antitoxin [Acinetobacter populi]OUY05954.1 DUF2191 domain-containing protein [Acinetobacter populi]SNX44988.1 antitoxin of type II TA system, VapB [Acinetobacter puyangensis]